jgi:hypothetical protein
MNIINGMILIFFIIGLILLIIYFTLKNQNDTCNQKIIYKYLPRTLKEQEESPVFVSEIFKTMFTQPSVWIDSIDRDNIDIMPKDNLDKFFISQF